MCHPRPNPIFEAAANSDPRIRAALDQQRGIVNTSTPTPEAPSLSSRPGPRRPASKQNSLQISATVNSAAGVNVPR